MKVKLARDWRHYKSGFVLDTSPGVADLLVRRLKRAEFIETLVPAVPGLSQLVGSVKRKKGS